MRLTLGSKLLVGMTGLVVGFVAATLLVLSQLLDDYAGRQAEHELEHARRTTAKWMAIHRRAAHERGQALASFPGLPALLADAHAADDALQDMLAAIQRTSAAPALLIGGLGSARIAGVPTSLRFRARDLGLPGIRQALAGETVDALWEIDGTLHLAVTVPVVQGADVVGWLSTATPLDDDAAIEIAGVTASEVLLLWRQRLYASSGAARDGDAVTAIVGAVQSADPNQPTIQLPSASGPRPALAVPLHATGGHILLVPDMGALAALRQSGWRWMLGGGVLVVLLGSLLSRYLTRRLCTPLEELTVATEAFSRGDWTVAVDRVGDDEVGQLGRAFNEMATHIGQLVREVRTTALQAELANRAKDRFLASIGHELRTPMTSIRAYTEILLSYGEDASPAELAEFLAIIDGECARLSSLFENVLDFVTLSTGKGEWRLQRVDLGDLTHEAVDAIRPTCAEKNLRLRVEATAAPLFGDRARLLQLIGHLLSNAWKFSPPGAAIDVEVTAGEHLELRVADRGPGIHGVESKEAVFAMFHQEGDVLTDKPQGTGLGLAIAREIVVMHGGSAWCEDRDGGGSVFVVRLPDAESGVQRPIDTVGKPAEEPDAALPPAPGPATATDGSR